MKHLLAWTALVPSSFLLIGCATGGPPLPPGQGGLVLEAIARQDEDVLSHTSIDDPFETGYPQVGGAARYDYDRFEDLVVWMEGIPEVDEPLDISWTGKAIEPPLSTAGPDRTIRLVNRSDQPVVFFGIDEVTGEEFEWPVAVGTATSDLEAPGEGTLYLLVDAEESTEAILYRAPGRAAVISSHAHWIVGPLPPGEVVVGGWHPVLPAGERTVRILPDRYTSIEILFSVDVLETSAP